MHVDLRPLGSTGLRVSPIAFGAFKIGRNVGIKYPRAYDLPSDAEVDRLLNGVLDLGINLIDTAPAYGTSEEQIGRAIAHRRGEFVISTKVGERFDDGRSTFDFSMTAVNASVDQSLRRLRTDRLDIVLVHSHGRDLEVLTQTDVVEALLARKAAGDIGAAGFSGKTVEGERAASQWADVLMIEYNLEDRTHEGAVAHAASHGTGVLIKKGLGSGSLDAAHSIDFILSNPHVDALVIGGLNLAHIESNVRIAEGVRGVDA